MDQVIANQGRREFTRIYKPTIVDDVHQGNAPLPLGYRLEQNYPNPFNSSTVIRFAVPPGSGGRRVRLSVYDLLGREVKKLLDEVQGAGGHIVSWDGRDNVGTTVGSGAYLIVMRAENYIKAIKALYLK
jgi:hypothetical protein